jgi:mannosyltransferase
MKRWRRFADAVAVLVVWVAFGLRLYRLEAHSLWSDEGISILRSTRPLADLLATMPVEQLPGYFVLLHFWLGVAGTSDFTVRFFSVWPGVLAVALVYRLGVDLARPDATSDWARGAGLFGALLLAVNPFQVWYAQEARTYSWLVASALLATWSFWRLLVDLAATSPTPGAKASGRTAKAGSKPGGWGEEDVGNGQGIGVLVALYVAGVTLTVYLHYYGFLVPLAHTIFFAGWFVYWREEQVALVWGGAGLVILLLFLPWLPRALGILSFSGWREPIDPWTIPWRFLTAYTTGEAAPDEWRNWLTWLYLVLAALGVVGWWRHRPAAALFLLAQTLIPWVAVFALALRQPDTHERYAIFIAPPLLLLVGGGLSWLAGWGRVGWPAPIRATRPLAGLLLVLLILAGGVAMARQYSEPAFQKPDFRGAAYAIQDWERPGDVILVDGPDPQLVFLHYYKGELPVHDLRFLGGAEFATIETTLSELTQDASRVWEVLFFHEPGPVQFWLATHGWSVPPTEYNGIRVTLYGLGEPDLVATGQPLDVAFGPALTLTQAAVAPATARPADVIQVTTWWQVEEPPPEYKFSLRLTTAEGAPIQFQDYVPQNWFTPTSSWPVGEITSDQRGFLLPRDLPPGRYAITLRLYDPASGMAVETATVETATGQDVLLGTFEVAPD